MLSFKLGLVLLFGILMIGCAPWEPKLTFPVGAIRERGNETWYDVNRDGKADFGVGRGVVLYDDDEDGTVDRVYELSDYANEDVPHVIVLLDSLPFEVVRERYERGDFRWMGEPVKVIGPFPTLTELCYTRVLHAPPLPGMTDEFYDVGAGTIHEGYGERSRGERQPWERRLAYHASFFEATLTYLDPKDWLPVEMGRIKKAIDDSPDRVTIVYAVTASGMACKYGRAGMEETLDAAKQLCLQLLYERHGAIKISIMADHGHNLVESHSAQRALEKAIEGSGFRVQGSVKSERDVVVELAALVDYVGLRTVHPKLVAEAVTRAKEVELAAYLQGSSVIVRNAQGAAAIDYRDGAFRYRVIDPPAPPSPPADVLGYQAVVEKLKKDADGFATDREWFHATVDHRYPDGPRRLWDAFHGLVRSPPDVMVTLKDGFYAGKASLERFITMKSTHGSLDQQNTATFVMTMTGRLKAGEVLRGGEVLGKIEPRYEPRVVK
jgi:hypothetical protein